MSHVTTDLSGQVAIVTGAAQGIGRAFTEILLRKGAQVSEMHSVELWNTICVPDFLSYNVGFKNRDRKRLINVTYF